MTAKAIWLFKQPADVAPLAPYMRRLGLDTVMVWHNPDQLGHVPYLAAEGFTVIVKLKAKDLANSYPEGYKHWDKVAAVIAGDEHNGSDTGAYIDPAAYYAICKTMRSRLRMEGFAGLFLNGTYATRGGLFAKYGRRADVDYMRRMRNVEVLKGAIFDGVSTVATHCNIARIVRDVRSVYGPDLPIYMPTLVYRNDVLDDWLALRFGVLKRQLGDAQRLGVKLCGLWCLETYESKRFKQVYGSRGALMPVQENQTTHYKFLRLGRHILRDWS